MVNNNNVIYFCFYFKCTIVQKISILAESVRQLGCQWSKAGALNTTNFTVPQLCLTYHNYDNSDWSEVWQRLRDCRWHTRLIWISSSLQELSSYHEGQRSDPAGLEWRLCWLSILEGHYWSEDVRFSYFLQIIVKYLRLWGPSSSHC